MGAEVVLGDRPIEITLARAWAALSREERGAVLLAGAGLVLGVRLSGSSSDSSSENLLPVPALSFPPLDSEGGRWDFRGYRGADDAVLASLERFGQAFPSLFEALIGERDRFLAWAAKRSKAVNGAKRVVAVVGALHLPGMVAAIRRDNGGETLSFSGVARLPSVQGREGDGGVSLSPAMRRLVGRAVSAWAVQGLPRVLRDVVVGTAVFEGLKLSYAQAAPQLEGWWAKAVGGALPPPWSFLFP